MNRIDGPYVGLEYFREEDEHLFFGRDADRRRIIGSLGAARLTLLYAESGVGKSSLLRAGVAAPLRARSGAYVPVVFNDWRSEPTGPLIAELQASVAHFQNGEGAKPLPTTSLEEALEHAARESGAMPLVILDQFEDHLLYSKAGGRFDEALATCVNRADLPANFLISIRQDAYAEIGNRFKAQIPNVYGNFQHLDFLDAAAAHEAAEGPLHKYPRRPGQPFEIEPELIDQLLTQIRDLRRDLDEGAHGMSESRVETTFLQLALQRVWKAECDQQSDTMRLVTLNDKLGGAKEIVQTHLDSVMSALPRPQRDAWAKGFRMLVTSSGRKIAMSIPDVAKAVEVAPKMLEPALEHLEDERILRKVPMRGPGNSASWEIFHDALAAAILDWRRRWVDKRLRRRANRRALLIGGGIFAALVLVVFAVWAVDQSRGRGEATKEARVLTLTAAAEHQLATRPDISAQFAFQAFDETRDLEHRNLVLQAVERLATDNTVGVLSGDMDIATDVAFGPGGGVLASASTDGNVELWDTASRRRIATVHAGRVAALAMSRDDDATVSVVGSDGKVRVWSVSTRPRVERRFSLPSAPDAAAFSADGRTLAVAGGDGVEVYDMRTGTRRSQALGPFPVLTRLAFSGNGNVLAAANDRLEIRVWKLRRGRLGTPSEIHPPTRVRGPVRGANPTGPSIALAVSHSGRALALAYNSRSILRIDVRRRKWDRLKTGFEVRALAVSRDGKRLAAGGNHTVGVYSTDTWTPVTGDLAGHTNYVNGVAFSPDGENLASAGSDRTVRLWRIAGGARTAAREAPVDSTGAIAISPDNRSLASSTGDGAVRLWDVEHFPNGARDVVAGAGLGLAVAFSRDGRLIATANTGGQVRLLDAASGRAFGETTLLDNASSLAFDPNGRVLATAGLDGTIRLLDTRTFAQIGPPLVGHTDFITSIAFSPEGRTLASVSYDQTLRLWNARTHELIKVIKLGLEDALQSVAYSPDGRSIATASTNWTIAVWDARTARRRLLLTGHRGPVTSVAFTPDGRTLVSGSRDRSIRLWDVGTGQPVGSPIRVRTEVANVAISPDGRSIAYNGRDGTLGITHATLQTSVTDLQRAICRVIGPGLSQRDWAHYVEKVQNAPYRHMCR